MSRFSPRRSESSRRTRGSPCWCHDPFLRRGSFGSRRSLRYVLPTCWKFGRPMNSELNSTSSDWPEVGWKQMNYFLPILILPFRVHQFRYIHLAHHDIHTSLRSLCKSTFFLVLPHTIYNLLLYVHYGMFSIFLDCFWNVDQSSYRESTQRSQTRAGTILITKELWLRLLG